MDIFKTINQRLSVEYIDTGLDNNSTHKYRIKAFTFNDVESAPTQPLVATTKPLPKVQQILEYQIIFLEKYFNLGCFTNSDIVKYDIHRSIYSSFGYKKLQVLMLIL